MQLLAASTKSCVVSKQVLQLQLHLYTEIDWLPSNLNLSEEMSLKPSEEIADKKELWKEPCTLDGQHLVVFNNGIMDRFNLSTINSTLMLLQWNLH